MGSPELPNEDENTLRRPQAGSLPMHGHISDESENENMEEDGYVGYQPLAIGEDETNDMDYSNDEEDFEVSLTGGCLCNFLWKQYVQSKEAATGGQAPDTSVNVISVDAEVEGEVWNAPRPDSLTIELDSTKSAQVGFTALTLLGYRIKLSLFSR